MKLKGKPPLKGARISSHEAALINWDTRTPVFSFRHLVASHGVSGCSDAEKAAILDALHKRSQLTWRELKSAPRHGLGGETIAQNGMLVGMPGCVTPDTTLLAYRCVGKAPMIGFRDEDRFHILWFDLRFDCYKH